MNSYINKVFELADASVKRYEPEKLNWSWGQALYLYALSLIDTEFGGERYTAYIKKYYDHHIKRVTGSTLQTPLRRLSLPFILLRKRVARLTGLLLRGCADILMRFRRWLKICPTT